MERRDKINYYLDLAESVSQRGTCMRRHYGVHAEANAIISASRDKMLGSSLYLVGIDMSTGDYVKDASSCSMCKRMIINAGIEKVYIRDTRNDYRMVLVQDWIDNDESLEGVFGY